ncbi:MAG: hypothetical protein PHE55_17170 [Methylococcaceae bacterium]|nr:hypothetical protein [Methylococcaceae bacterium]
MIKFNKFRAKIFHSQGIFAILVVGILSSFMPAFSTYGAPNDSVALDRQSESVMEMDTRFESTSDSFTAGNVSIIAMDPKPLTIKSGEFALAGKIIDEFKAFNAQYQNQWKASFDPGSGKITNLYGTQSRQYKDGPESVARGFLTDSGRLFGLKEDLSDLSILRVDPTPLRNHVRFQQTYEGIPVADATVLVHATPIGQVTMVQNGYVSELKVINRRSLMAEAAIEIAREDLQKNLGANIALLNIKAEEWITFHKGEYYFVWKIIIPTQNPWGLWVYQIDAETGNITYKGDEILQLRSGTGLGYLNNANWHVGKIGNLSLMYLYTSKEKPNSWGYLWGPHSNIINTAGYEPRASDYKFNYNPVTQKDWFHAVNAYYKINTSWTWWKTLISKYKTNPYYFYNYSAPVFVNAGICNAYYSSDITGNGDPGFVFGNENSCAQGSEDFALDEDVVRHEYTHAMMNWLGFGGQFGSYKNYYGRAMGEGNGDWFGYIIHPKNPKMGDVAENWTRNGYGINLDNTRTYPRDVNYPDSGMPEEHYTGEIWGGYLYDLYRMLGNKAVPYVYNAYYYFSSAGGLMDGFPDFFDGIRAQINADNDLNKGKTVSSIMAWGSMSARGISGGLRMPYRHGSNYFFTGKSGSDAGIALAWNFPPLKSINTSSNLLNAQDRHEYVIQITQTGKKLTSAVTSKSLGILNPSMELRDFSGDLLAVGGGSSTKSVLSYANLSAGYYIIMVKGQNSAPGRGYYGFSIAVK